MQYEVRCPADNTKYVFPASFIQAHLSPSNEVRDSDWEFSGDDLQSSEDSSSEGGEEESAEDEDEDEQEHEDIATIRYSHD